MEGLTEPQLRFGTFAIAFVLLAAYELLRPRRKPAAVKTRRWLTNLSIVALDGIVVRLMASLAVPIAAVAAADLAQDRGIGFFNWTEWPAAVEVLIAVVVLDFAIWLQHLISHKIPLLWRLHQVHHADVDIDVTTAIRFHPIEIALSVLWKILWVFALGAPVVAVIAFEIILNACAMFNHANIAIGERADRVIRTLIVTPDMHRVHHSVLRHEHDSNYGFNLSIWDRLFRTYTPAPEGGHLGMTIGLRPYQSDDPTRLGWSLSLPFKHLRPADNQEKKSV